MKQPQNAKARRNISKEEERKYSSYSTKKYEVPEKKKEDGRLRIQIS